MFISIPFVFRPEDAPEFSAGSVWPVHRFLRVHKKGFQGNSCRGFGHVSLSIEYANHFHFHASNSIQCESDVV